jgi:hypothetical protein
MDSTGLRAVQQPLKDAYREDPQQAVITLRARGELGDEGISCSVDTGRAMAVGGGAPAPRGRRGPGVCRCGRWPRRWRSR